MANAQPVNPKQIPTDLPDPSVTLRYRLRRFFLLYNPTKLGDIELILIQFRGAEGLLFELLEKKYGAEPTQETTLIRVKRFYEEYAPSKIDNAVGAVALYTGQTDLLYAHLERKYGPEPMPPAPVVLLPSGEAKREDTALISEFATSKKDFDQWREKLMGFFSKHAIPKAEKDIEVLLRPCMGPGGRRFRDVYQEIVARYDRPGYSYWFRRIRDFMLTTNDPSVIRLSNDQIEELLNGCADGNFVQAWAIATGQEAGSGARDADFWRVKIKNFFKLKSIECSDAEIDEMVADHQYKAYGPEILWSKLQKMFGREEVYESASVQAVMGETGKRYLHFDAVKKVNKTKYPMTQRLLDNQPLQVTATGDVKPRRYLVRALISLAGGGSPEVETLKQEQFKELTSPGRNRHEGSRAGLYSAPHGPPRTVDEWYDAASPALRSRLRGALSEDLRATLEEAELIFPHPDSIRVYSVTVARSRCPHAALIFAVEVDAPLHTSTEKIEHRLLSSVEGGRFRFESAQQVVGEPVAASAAGTRLTVGANGIYIEGGACSAALLQADIDDLFKETGTPARERLRQHQYDAQHVGYATLPAVEEDEEAKGNAKNQETEEERHTRWDRELRIKPVRSFLDSLWDKTLVGTDEFRKVATFDAPSMTYGNTLAREMSKPSKLSLTPTVDYAPLPTRTAAPTFAVFGRSVLDDVSHTHRYLDKDGEEVTIGGMNVGVVNSAPDAKGGTPMTAFAYVEDELRRDKVQSLLGAIREGQAASAEKELRQLSTSGEVFSPGYMLPR